LGGDTPAGAHTRFGIAMDEVENACGVLVKLKIFHFQIDKPRLAS